MDPGFPPPREGPNFGGPPKPFVGGGVWPTDDDPIEPRKMYWDPMASPTKLTHRNPLVNSIPSGLMYNQAVLVVVVAADTVVYKMLDRKEVENVILFGKRSQGFTAAFDRENMPGPKTFPELHALFAGESVWPSAPPPGPFKAVYTVRFDQG